MNRYFHTLLALVLSGVLMLNSAAYAQNGDIEPNQTCSTAQDLGAITLPLTVDGSLDSTEERSDVDFFRLAGTPGEVVRVDLKSWESETGALGNPYLGFFDSSCNLVASNNDGGVSISNSNDSSLLLIIPSDGVFIMAAASCCDFAFVGDGNNTPGTYQMTVTPSAAIGSISGQVVNAYFGEPLPGDTEPFTNVSLLRCINWCFGVNSQRTDSEGRFRFSSDSSGSLLEVGTYQIVAEANEYNSASSDLVTVAAAEHLNINVLLQPFPVKFSDVRPCYNLNSKGGICRYSVKVTNRLNTSLYGKAWSTVLSYPPGLPDFTRFQVKTVTLKLKPRKSKNIHYEIRVPAGRIAAGGRICTDIYVGQDPHALYNTVGYKDLFCITKDESGFKVIPAKKTQEMLRQMSGKSAHRSAIDEK